MQLRVRGRTAMNFRFKQRTLHGVSPARFWAGLFQKGSDYNPRTGDWTG
jgi:hypothetical protein